MSAQNLRRLVACLVVNLLLASLPGQSHALPPGFQEEVVFSGLVEPTAVQFSPDGRVFVAEKSGLIKVYPALYSTTPTIFADLRVKVHNFWDRGLLGMVLHPNFPATPYVYVLYTYDAAIGGTAPRWGSPNAQTSTSDSCPSPPGATADGCVVSGRLSRLTAVGNVSSGGELVLVEDWCQQFPSHSIGSLAFASDGALIVSGGDGASFNYVDYGQTKNSCGDPPVSAGTNQTLPNAEGGALRSESPERPTTEPRLLNGAVLRLDPATGTALPDNPMYGSSSANERRIVAYGLRNPFRIATRPGTSEIWVGDVGWNDVEEINRITSPAGPLENFAWPCYEGIGRQSGYDGANITLCESLYNRGGAATAPTFQYRHSDVVVSGDGCPTGSSSVTGLAFYGSGAYPPAYAGALFFADYSRRCIWTIFNPTGEQGGSTPSLSYGFGEGSGPSSADLSGHNRAASLVGGVTWTTSGASGNAVQLNGTTGYVSVANAGMPSGDFTASLWIYLTRNTTFQTVMEALDPASLGWELDLEVGGLLSVWSNGVPRLTTSAAIPLNTWTYVTLKRQGALWIVFLNGVPQGETGSDPTAFSFGTCPFTIGLDADIGCTGALNGYLQGRVDEVRVYARALSQAEIQADMANPVGPTAPSGPSVPTSVQGFVTPAASPVDLKIGPNGDLFYVDLSGSIRRIRYGTNQAPTAVATASPTNGAAPLQVAFDGRASSDPDPGDTISFAWDLDGDGQFDDSTQSQPVWTYAQGTYTARLQVTDSHGATGYSGPISITVTTGTPNTPPNASIDSPQPSLLWQVGGVVNFSGHADDPDEPGGVLPASGLTWTLNLQHCDSTCHTHHLTDFVGVASGSFVAPDHEYPSYLELKLTATDPQGATSVKTIALNPLTVSLGFQSSPSGLQVTVGSASQPTPFSRTVIVGSANSASAPSPQTLNSTNYTFVSWSDGGAQTHSIVAGSSATTYTATYQQSTAPPPPPPATPRLAYGFNEGSGTTSADSSGNNKTATLVGGVTWTSTAVSGNAVQLNGTSGYISVASPGLSGTDFTALGWVYLTRNTVFQTVMEMLTSSSKGWELDVEPGGTISVYTNDILRLTTSATVPLNTWTYLALRRQGSVWTLFINGVAQTPTATDTTTFNYGSSCPFKIGVDADSGCTGALNGYLQGRIDGVRVYNRALSDAEVQGSMAAIF